MNDLSDKLRLVSSNLDRLWAEATDDHFIKVGHVRGGADPLLRQAADEIDRLKSSRNDWIKEACRLGLAAETLQRKLSDAIALLTEVRERCMIPAKLLDRIEQTLQPATSDYPE